ncbi:MAG: cupin domain-containing protein [Pseudomonadota bacterium]
MKSISTTHYDDIKPYITRDGSLIRELMHPQHHNNIEQSLAEAEIPACSHTFLHVHHKSEELYHVIEGYGTMILGKNEFYIQKGDTVHISAGTSHAVKAHDVTLKILCCCSPPYSHQDTELCAHNDCGSCE